MENWASGYIGEDEVIYGLDIAHLCPVSSMQNSTYSLHVDYDKFKAGPFIALNHESLSTCGPWQDRKLLSSESLVHES